MLQLMNSICCIATAVSVLSVCACTYGKEEHLKLKAKNGDVQAMHDLGMANLSTNGDGFVSNPNYRDAVFWLKAAAKQGNTTSMYFLSQINGQPDGEQTMWLIMGADLGDPACMIRLRDGYAHGVYGLPRDRQKSEGWQKKIQIQSESELRRQGYKIP